MTWPKALIYLCRRCLFTRFDQIGIFLQFWKASLNNVCNVLNNVELKIGFSELKKIPIWSILWKGIFCTNKLITLGQVNYYQNGFTIVIIFPMNVKIQKHSWDQIWLNVKSLMMTFDIFFGKVMITKIKIRIRN